MKAIKDFIEKKLEQDKIINSSDNSIIIEDSNIGVEAGLNSGIEVVMIPDLVRHQGKTLISRVKVYKNMNEVISLISEINGY